MSRQIPDEGAMSSRFDVGNSGVGRLTSNKMPLARRIFIAPLRYSSSWPIIPSIGGSGGFSAVESSGLVEGVVSPLPWSSGVANVTFLGTSTAFPFPLSTTGVEGSVAIDGGETNVGKFGGNWKK